MSERPKTSRYRAFVLSALAGTGFASLLGVLAILIGGLSDNTRKREVAFSLSTAAIAVGIWNYQRIRRGRRRRRKERPYVVASFWDYQQVLRRTGWTPAPKRRRFAYSLRTLFVAVTVLGIWLGYQLNWIRQRRDIISDPQVQYACCYETLKIEIVGNVKRPRKRRTYVAAPRPLSWFGEFGYAEIVLGKGTPAGELARVRSLFPEAQVMGDD